MIDYYWLTKNGAKFVNIVVVDELTSGIVESLSSAAEISTFEIIFERAAKRY